MRLQGRGRRIGDAGAARGLLQVSLGEGDQRDVAARAAYMVLKGLSVV